MKIRSLILKNFMLFEDARFNWSDHINVICGENSTGKTTLQKVMYSLLKPVSNGNSRKTTKDLEERNFVEKLQGIFRPDEMKIGRLVSRVQGSNRTDFSVLLDREQSISMGFGSKQENHADIKLELSDERESFDVIYIPTKEMISTTQYFNSLYEQYHIDFEEMYYDLGKLLERPLSKGPNTREQNEVLQSFEKIMRGKIVRKDKKFYLKLKGKGEFEMGLVSDGYRKLSMIIYLILSGSLNKNTVLFWDEPETNMNPKMIRPIVQAITALAGMGVQIFVTTHDYFVQQEFNMMALYPDQNIKNLDIRFLSLYYDEDSEKLMCEVRENATDLTHNAIMEEFDAMYDREQGYIYGD